MLDDYTKGAGCANDGVVVAIGEAEGFGVECLDETTVEFDAFR